MYQNSPDLFSFKINYDQVENPVGNVTGLHNGNISETYWRTASSNIKRSYGYEYDNLNRLTNAIYLKSDAQADAYNEALTYDANGNILTFARNGNYDAAPTTVEIDKLNYAYDSYNVNRLIKVTDLTNSTLSFSDGANNPTEYDYDGHGNMIRADNKGITAITYNHLNLPTQITFSGTTTRKIQYLYNAVGTKQKKVVTDGTVITTTDYLSGFQYQNNVLEFFPHAEGYVKFTEGYFNYVFNYTDHLGNVRLSYAQDPNGFATRILEETDEGGSLNTKKNIVLVRQNHYYPFGLKHTNYDNGTQRFKRGIGGGGDVPVFIAPDIFGSSAFKYKYNGKEFQDELGLNVTAMDFRQYDPAIGRFNGMDRLAELVPNMSPYRFAFNNPVYWSDPTGLLESNRENLEKCPTCPNTPEFKPLIDDPDTTYYYDPETKQASEMLDEVEVKATRKSDNNWWIIDSFKERNKNFDRPFNITLGAYGTVSTITEVWLDSERKTLERRGTKTDTKKIKKYVKPSINKVNKFSRRLGLAGAAYSAATLGYDIVSCQEITAGQVFDSALSIGLYFVAISNPIGMVAVGAYTVIDMYGGFDGIKEDLGMDTVIINNE